MDAVKEEYMEKFDILCGQLSPENLCCDGEISQTQVGIRHRAIMKQWRALEKQYGVKMDEDAVFQWSWAKYKEKSKA